MNLPIQRIFRAVPQALGTFSIMVALAMAGCGGAPTGGRLPISGEVLLDGQPLDEGAIHFEPSVEEKVKMDAGAVIKNGKYQLTTEHGLPPGKYIVSITSSAKDTRTADEIMKGGPDAEPPKQRIDAKYNSQTTLNVEVKPGANKFDFKVESPKQ